MKKSLIIVAVVLALLMIGSAVLSVVNFTSPNKKMAKVLYEEYSDGYDEAYDLWNNCRRYGFSALEEQAEDLMDTFSDGKYEQKEIVREYNTKGVIFLVIAIIFAIVAVVLILVAVIGKKKEEVVCDAAQPISEEAELEQPIAEQPVAEQPQTQETVAEDKAE